MYLKANNLLAIGFGDKKEPCIYFIEGLLLKMGLLKSCSIRERREHFPLDLNVSMSEMLFWWKWGRLEGQDASTFQITEAALLLSREPFIIGLQIINFKSLIPLSLLLHRLRNLCLKDTSGERIVGFFSIYGLRPIQLLQNWIFTTSSSTTTENGLNNQMWQSRIPLVWFLLLSHNCIYNVFVSYPHTSFVLLYLQKESSSFLWFSCLLPTPISAYVCVCVYPTAFT